MTVWERKGKCVVRCTDVSLLLFFEYNFSLCIIWIIHICSVSLSLAVRDKSKELSNQVRLEDFVMDLMPDDAHGRSQKRSMWKWDKRHKKYIRTFFGIGVDTNKRDFMKPNIARNKVTYYDHEHTSLSLSGTKRKRNESGALVNNTTKKRRSLYVM